MDSHVAAVFSEGTSNIKWNLTAWSRFNTDKPNHRPQVRELVDCEQLKQ